MYQTFFAQMESTTLPLFGFGVFALTFAMVLLRTYAFKRPHDYDAVAALPLADPYESTTSTMSQETKS